MIIRKTSATSFKDNRKPHDFEERRERYRVNQNYKNHPLESYDDFRRALLTETGRAKILPVPYPITPFRFERKRNPGPPNRTRSSRINQFCNFGHG
jgi:hypothetical protein